MQFSEIDIRKSQSFIQLIIAQNYIRIYRKNYDIL